MAPTSLLPTDGTMRACIIGLQTSTRTTTATIQPTKETVLLTPSPQRERNGMIATVTATATIQTPPTNLMHASLPLGPRLRTVLVAQTAMATGGPMQVTGSQIMLTSGLMLMATAVATITSSTSMNTRCT